MDYIQKRGSLDTAWRLERIMGIVAWQLDKLSGGKRPVSDFIYSSPEEQELTIEYAMEHWR